MLRLMFKHQTNDKQIDQGKDKRHKRKWHRLFVNPIRWQTNNYFGGY